MRGRRARDLSRRRSRWIPLRRFFARLVADVRVSAAEAKERVDLRCVDLVRLHLARDEDMVARLARVADDAPEDRHASGDGRRASRIRWCLERLDAQRRELVRPLRRFAGALGDVLLRRVEERNAERTALLDELAGAA